MKIGILCQEEPVFLNPFLQDVIRQRPGSVVGVIIAGTRSAGEQRRTLAERLESLRIFWLIFEPADFLRSVVLRARFRVLGRRDPRSVEGLARKLEIPVSSLPQSEREAVATAVARLDADLILNQSEILLDPRILSIPRRGFLNRHATLLPAHRGRLGSFRAHADATPRYGVTIHLVDEGVDTGPIVEQWEASDVDPEWPFPRVLRHLNGRAPALFWSAVDRLARGEPPRSNLLDDRRSHRFPTLDEARAYRATLARRRAGRT
jgi:methionyl-tRNA formyltransferase